MSTAPEHERASASAEATPWVEANQRYLMAAIGQVRAALSRYLAHGTDPAAAAASAEDSAAELTAATEALPAPAALQLVCAAFGLSQFERDLLLLCAGMELDAAFASLCAKAQGAQAAAPTFWLALSALPHAHWSALSPHAPLRRYRLIQCGPGSSLTQNPLSIDESVLHFLTGVAGLDERLSHLVEPLELQARRALPDAYQAAALRVCELLRRPSAQHPPSVQLCGSDQATLMQVAAQACEELGQRAFCLRASELVRSPLERDLLARLWERTALLSGAILLLLPEEHDSASESTRLLLAFAERLECPLILASPEPLRSARRLFLRVELSAPSRSECKALWQELLGPASRQLDEALERVTAHFTLSVTAMHEAAEHALSSASESDSESGSDPGSESVSEEAFLPILWKACRQQSRGRFDGLAQRIDPVATFKDLVLPEPQQQVLRDISVHVRNRTKVYDTWGFAGKESRGLGVSALFSGVSGTGKTLASEVLANELGLDLYRIDLSQLVSKYIGETEKNLRRIFDSAESGGAILLFDEADALFGKRSEVKDSHDRYANIEVSYLLQRMEAYRGLAILTTNLKTSLDPAFLRRISFVVQFPFPDHAQRREIWRRAFPTKTPTEELDLARLAQLNIAGGNIRNIALHAAFLAADANEPVQMAHILRAARSEYIKLEKPLSELESRGWT